MSVASTLPLNMPLAAQEADFLVRHEIHNVTADLMSEVCHSVGVEPSLQPVTGEHFEYRTAERMVPEHKAEIDSVHSLMSGFSTRCYQSSTLAQCHRKNELEKRAYEECVRETMCLHGSRPTFTPDTSSPMESIDLALHEGWVPAS